MESAIDSGVLYRRIRENLGVKGSASYLRNLQLIELFATAIRADERTKAAERADAYFDKVGLVHDWNMDDLRLAITQGQSDPRGDEVLALRAQVERQRATIEGAVKAIDEKGLSKKATRGMLMAALAQIESEEVGRC